MAPSDHKRPERLRGRVRGQVPVWSVLPVAVVVIVLGGMFWASMWLLLHKPASPVAVASADLTETFSSVYQADNDNDVMASADLTDADTPAVADTGDLAKNDNGDGDDVDASTTDDVDGPALAEDQAAGDVAAAGDDNGLSDVMFGPAEPPGFVEEPVLADAAGQPAADASGQATAKAEELTTRAEELTGRIEGLTAKIDDLTARLEASSAALAAVPSPVPSPVAVPRLVAAARAADPNTARTSQPGASQPASGGTRAPWVVLPLPEPGSRVTAGPIVLETRARGEAPITQIRLQLDGVALQVALEKRDDTTWRGTASTRVGAGSHTVAVAVVDGQGRVGSYRWQFNASGS
jgi:hypothetical protein